MTRKPVRSSNIKSVGHDPATNTLEVEFHSGARHQYPDVSEQTYRDFIAAPSVGKYFHRNVKPLGGEKVA